MATFIAPFAANKPAQPVLIDEFKATSWDSFNCRVNQSDAVNLKPAEKP